MLAFALSKTSTKLSYSSGTLERSTGVESEFAEKSDLWNVGLPGGVKTSELDDALAEFWNQ